MAEQAEIVVYLSKYGLTKGIIEARGIPSSPSNTPDDFRYCDCHWGSWWNDGRAKRHITANLFATKGEWHRTLEEAKAEVEKMRLAKLKAIERQQAAMLGYVPKIVPYEQPSEATSC